MDFNKLRPLRLGCGADRLAAGPATIRRSIEARYRGEEVFQEETRVACMDGTVMDVVFARPGAIADKSLVGFIDITERKKAEEALHKREREFSQLVNMVPSYLWRLTSDGVPNFFNRRLIEFLGVDAGDANVAGVHPLSLLSLGPSCIRMTRHA